MATDENTTTRELITTALRAFETQDTVAAASAFANHGVFVDPRYPESEYEGPEEIREAFDWGLTNVVDQPRFTIRTFVEEDEICTVEVVAHHVAKDGTERALPQVFVVESSDAGITRWQTYLSCSPE